MKRIETEYWKPSTENQDKLEYDGQRPAQEVFQELRYRLVRQGYLPDEYFLLADAWGNGRLYPADGHLLFDVSFGCSEGIYLDITIQYTDENQTLKKEKFATGKTLGESTSDLDRMYLIASACTKAFHTDGLHARYMTIGAASSNKGITIHLSEAEKAIMIDSLIDFRSRNEDKIGTLTPIEQLLRRILGSITEYIEAVGIRPQILSPYDYTLLCIRDSNVVGFRMSYPNVSNEEIGDLLTRAARSPGRVGKEMTDLLLAKAQDIPCETYIAACKSAINACDLERTLMLIDKAEHIVKDLESNMYMFGEVIKYALHTDERCGYTAHIALALAKKYTPEQIVAADPRILETAIWEKNSSIFFELINKGIPHDPDKIIYHLAVNHNIQLLYMFRRQKQEDLQYTGVFRLLMHRNIIDAAIFLLQHDVDFSKLSDSLKTEATTESHKAFLDILTHYWENNIKPKSKNNPF